MSKVYQISNRKGQDVATGGRIFKTRSGGFAEAKTPLVGANGQYNASSKADLINALKTLTDGLLSGELSREAKMPMDRAAAARMVKAALADPHKRGGGPFERLGQVVGEMISEVMGRMAFTDKVMALGEFTEGGTARVEVDQMDVVAWHLVHNAQVAESLSSPKFIYPEGFWLSCLLFVNDEDQALAGASFLERKYQRALEAMLVREDNVWKFLADLAAPVANDVLSFATFTPSVFAALRHQLLRWTLNAATCILAVDMQQDILADSDWHGVYSPVEQHELFEEGFFGSVFGVELLSDGYREDNLRVLAEGEVYMLSAPQTHGQKIPMIDLRSEPVDQLQHGRLVHGWSVSQYEAMVLANSRSVSKGIKL